MSHNTYPLLLYEPLRCFFFYNSYLILQKSSLTTEKIVQRKENFLMRDYAQQRCNNILLSLVSMCYFLSSGNTPISHTHPLSHWAESLADPEVEKDDFSSSHSR